MEQLKQALLEAGINASDTAIAAYLNELGLTESTLTPDWIDQIVADQFKQQSSSLIKPANGKKNGLAKTDAKGAAASTQPKRGKRSTQQVEATPANLLQVAATASNEEIQAFNQTAADAVDRWTDREAENFVATIRSAPTQMIQKIGALAAEEVGDPEFFRQQAERFCSAFGISE
jgi:uncharacterized damage-inducible protein DinB